MCAVFCGGSLGTLARAALAETVAHDPGGWPWATLLANLVAAGLLGYVVARMEADPPHAVWARPLLGPGLCGGLSTFSAMQLELLQMLDAGHVGLALGYTVVSLVAGFAALTLTRRLVPRPGVAA
jgi:CrcB protein